MEERKMASSGLKRVVITGMGGITPLGSDIEKSWRGVVNGATAVDRITDFDTEALQTQIASQIRYDYLPILEEYLDKRTTLRVMKRSARFAHFAIIAAGEGLRNAELLDDERKIPSAFRDSTAIFIGTSGGAIDEISACAQSIATKHLYSPEEFIRLLSGFVKAKGWIARESFDIATAQTLMDYAAELIRSGKSLTNEDSKKFVAYMARFHSAAVLKALSDFGGIRSSIAFGARGGLNCAIAACATGSVNIGTAFNHIKLGKAKIIVAGGADACVNPVGHWMFSLLNATSKRNHDPKHASRPFDKERDGFVMAEGAAVLVLEELTHALKRGAPIYAELLDWAMTSDAQGDTDPEEETQAIALKLALDCAGIAPDEVDHVNAHGTSTPKGDSSETKAIKQALGEQRARRIPISSVKSSMGHLLGAAGSFEAICCVKTINESVVPPTINYEFPDPECDLDYVPSVARKHRVRVALNNSFGLGGQSCVLVLKAIEP